MNNPIYEEIVIRTQRNFDDVVKTHLQMPPEKILGRIYHLNFVNEWYIFLTSEFSRLTQDAEALKWLAGLDKPIDELYKLFLECDDAPHYDWDVMYELIVSFMEYEKEIKEEKK